MTVTIGALTFGNLTAQPFGYEETDTKAGLTARQWAIQGLLTASDYLDLLDEYNNWRDSRIQDEDTSTSLVVGTTVLFSGTGPGSITWTNIPCWFSSAPGAEQSGEYLAVSFTIVDANEALEVIQKQQESEATTEEDNLPDLGTFNLGGVLVKLTKPVNTYLDGPQLNLSALGFHYVSGPKVAQNARDVEGYFDSDDYPSGVSTINSWYQTAITSNIAPGGQFPVSVPSFSAQKVIVNGIAITRYTVNVLIAIVI